MAEANRQGFTGRHMAGVLVASFGVVIAVNVANARLASSTFGGEVVENSYVASQDFNRWLDEAKNEKALGWDEVTTWRPDGRIVVAVKGAPADVAVAGVARHPLGRLPDRAIVFEPIGGGRFLSRQPLPDERWDLRVTLTAAGRTWRRQEQLR